MYHQVVLESFPKNCHVKVRLLLRYFWNFCNTSLLVDVTISLMRVIHRVPDKFTSSRQAHDTFATKNSSRWISFNFVRDTFTTCSRQISTHVSFATRSNMFDLVANESWSRLCCRRFGQSTSRMPSCEFYVHDAQVLPKPSHDVETKPTLLEIIFNVTSLPHDSFATAVGNLVDHPHYIVVWVNVWF
jgi:hypothetical protein